MRSILSRTVHVLALTATATSEVFKTVVTRLSMDDPAIIGLPPTRENIKYYVEPLPAINVFCELITDNLLSKRTDFQKL